MFDPANLRSYSGSSDGSRMMQFAGECNLLTDGVVACIPAMSATF